MITSTQLRVTAVAALTLAATGTSQNTFTSPAGFAAREGVGGAYYMGGLADGRQVILDGEYRNQQFALKAVAFRADHRDYSAYEGQGRRWSSVELTVAECDIAARQRTFTRIGITPPASVFKRAVTWPTLTGTPASTPAAWQFRFPFSRSWSYSGKGDIMLDWNFSGGVLANNGTWGEGVVSYHLDASHSTAPYGDGAVRLFGTAGINGGCIDAGSANSFGAFTNLVSQSYPASYTIPSLRNMNQTRIYSYYTAPDVPVAYAVGLAGGRAVTFPGVSCNQLYVDTTQPTFYLFGLAGAGAAYYGTDLNLRTFVPATVGVEIFAQGGWRDSKTGQFKLTRASSVKIPDQPAPLPNRQVLYATRPTQTAGYGPYLYQFMLPVVQFTR